MTNAQWKAMLARNGETPPRQTAAERREFEKGWREQYKRFNEFAMQRMLQEQATYYQDSSNEDL